MHKLIRDITEMKLQERKISVVTSYDYTVASLCDRAGVDILLVGDSAGMVMLGYNDTRRVTMEQMCVFTEGVSNGRENALVVADLPFLSYQTSIRDAIYNSGRLVKAGADAVKLEGGVEVADTVHAITQAGIPVMGHIGVQPQTAVLSDGYKVQGKTAMEALRLVDAAKALESAGAFSIVLEMVTTEAADVISKTIKIPTIGIGSGNYCDGQVLVIQDLLGMYDKLHPKFVKRYKNLTNDIIAAIKEYDDDVKSDRFPSQENYFRMSQEELIKLSDVVDK